MVAKILNVVQAREWVSAFSTITYRLWGPSSLFQTGNKRSAVPEVKYPAVQRSVTVHKGTAYRRFCYQWQIWRLTQIQNSRENYRSCCFHSSSIAKKLKKNKKFCFVCNTKTREFSTSPASGATAVAWLFFLSNRNHRHRFFVTEWGLAP